MTSDLDIFRSAQALVKQHGQDAPIHAAMRADAMLALVHSGQETLAPVAGERIICSMTFDGEAIMRRLSTLATVLLGLAFFPIGETNAVDPSTFGAKQWLLSPPPERLTPLQKHRASVYRSDLQREIRRLELRGPQTNIRSIDRLNTFRSELSRIERATRNRQRY